MKATPTLFFSGVLTFKAEAAGIVTMYAGRIILLRQHVIAGESIHLSPFVLALHRGMSIRFTFRTKATP